MIVRKLGSELRVGDTLEVWWTPGRDTITDLIAYRGPLQDVFPEGAQLASFAILKSGMTIDNGDTYNVLPSRR